MTCKRVIVSGRVQGVFFRDSCRTTAVRHGVRGWVRNLSDGTVEARFEGAPDAVDRLVAWAHEGPPAAQVERVEVHDETPEGGQDGRGGPAGFEVRPTPPAPLG